MTYLPTCQKDDSSYRRVPRKHSMLGKTTIFHLRINIYSGLWDSVIQGGLLFFPRLKKIAEKDGFLPTNTKKPNFNYKNQAQQLIISFSQW